MYSLLFIDPASTPETGRVTAAAEVDGPTRLVSLLLGPDSSTPPYPACVEAESTAVAMFTAYARASAAAKRLADAATRRAALVTPAPIEEVLAADEDVKKWSELFAQQTDSRERLAKRLWDGLSAWALPSSPLTPATAAWVHLYPA